MNKPHEIDNETAFILARTIELVRNLVPNEKGEIVYLKFNYINFLLSEIFPIFFFPNLKLKEEFWILLSEPQKLEQKIKPCTPSFKVTEACQIIFGATSARKGWSIQHRRIELAVDYFKYLKDEFGENCGYAPKEKRHKVHKRTLFYSISPNFFLSGEIVPANNIELKNFSLCSRPSPQ